jgi:hypothetical protein
MVPRWRVGVGGARSGWLVAALLLALPAGAQPTYDVTVKARRPVTSGSQWVRDAERFDQRRLDRPDRVLEVIPSLLTAQHAGGGKSNQYLVRGFDADHGTDFAFFVDGVPMNMRSHAHGQGFAEMHWLIPEAIQQIDVSMGPYAVEYGDFATAGAANLQLWDRVPESYWKVSGGEFTSIRTVGVYSPTEGPFGGDDPRARLFAAVEFNVSDGPFENEENLLQYKGLVRFGCDLTPKTQIEGWFAAYDGRWNASGQIPQRFTNLPGNSRWDSADPTDGGHSDRQVGLVRLTHDFDENRRLEVASWASHYRLRMYSNFTLFLDPPQPCADLPEDEIDSCILFYGNGIVQDDDRWYFGNTAIYRQRVDWRLPVVFTAGLDHRTDLVTPSLGQQRRRTEFALTAYDDIEETSIAGYLQADVLLAPWARLVFGARAEGFFVDVDSRRESQTGPRPSGREQDAVALPKANLILSPFGEDGPLPVAFQPLRDAKLFLNWGQGYHSNDARDVVANPDETTLPIAMGWEVGLRVPVEGWLDVSFAYWWLDLQNEFVFVGDAGETEEKGRSRRQGVEVSARVTPLPWLEGEVSVAYSTANFNDRVEVEEGVYGDNVPQAPRLVAKASLLARHASGISAELDFTALGRRYATEADSPKLHGYGVFDFSVRYRRGPFEAALGLDNIFDANWRSSEFYYESRLQQELENGEAGQNDFHSTPGYPRNVWGGVTWYFD